MLHEIASRRLRRGRLTVVDATNVQREARDAADEDRARARPVRGRDRARPARASCATRATRRGPDRDFGEHVIRRQRTQLKRSLRHLQREGFRRAFVLKSEEEVAARRVHALADVDRPAGRARAVRRHRRRPRLLRRAGRAARRARLRRRRAPGGAPARVRRRPRRPRAGRGRGAPARDGARAGRDRRPGQPRRQARAQARRARRPDHARAGRVARAAAAASRRSSSRRWRSTCAGSSRTPCSTTGGSCVAHAGMPERYQGRGSRRVREFALYGETTGETDEFGLPVRGAWALDYRGAGDRRLRPHAGAGAGVAQQHDQHRHRLRVRRRADRAALAGARAGDRAGGAGVLRARAAVPGRRAGRPSARATCSTSTDVAGKRIIQTRLSRTVTIREENAAGALEVMSRFAIDPRWLVYLPPTMAPTATSSREDALEYPSEAFAEFRTEGVAQVVCEEKHMGSRAIAVVCRDEDVGRERFGIDGARRAVHAHRPAVPGRRAAGPGAGARRGVARRAVGGAGHRLARARLRAAAVVGEGDGADPAPVRRRRRGGPVGARGFGRRRWRPPPRAGSTSASCSSRTRDRAERVDRYSRRLRAATSGRSTASTDLRLAPFHVLAAESGVFAGRDHVWHLAALRRAGRRRPGLDPAHRPPRRRGHRPRVRGRRHGRGGRR